jgi:hypothetical protein
VKDDFDICDVNQQKCNNYKEIDQLLDPIGPSVKDDIDICDVNQQKCNIYNEIDQLLESISLFPPALISFEGSSGRFSEAVSAAVRVWGRTSQAAPTTRRSIGWALSRDGLKKVDVLMPMIVAHQNECWPRSAAPLASSVDNPTK